MRNYFTIGGRDSRDFGVYISGQGTFSAPARAYTFNPIPGRSGDVIGVERRFENTVLTYEAFIYRDFNENIQALRSFLLSLDGYQRLTDSYHPDEFREAVFVGPFEPVVTKRNNAAQFSLSLVCKPQRFLLTGEASYQFVPGGQTVTGADLYVYGQQLNNALTVTALNPGGEFNLADGPAPAPITEIAVDIDGQTAYTSTVGEADVYGLEANLIDGTATVTHTVTHLPLTGWERTSDLEGYYFRHSDLTNLGAGLEIYAQTCYIAEGMLFLRCFLEYQPNVLGGRIILRYYDSLQPDPTPGNVETFLARHDMWFVTHTGTSGSVSTVSPAFPRGGFNLAARSGSAACTVGVEYAQNDTLDNPTLFPAAPLIRVYGNGTVRINDITATVNSPGTYTDIDCDAMDCYEGAENRNRYVVFSSNDFPTLAPGPNEIVPDVNISRVDIVPRWWRL